MTDQEKREKVIKGLECCAHEEIGDCDNCPYNENTPHCDIAMMRDAIALLKAQEARLVHVTAEINYRKIGECPTCGKLINSGDYPNYCGCCGQVVKWE